MRNKSEKRKTRQKATGIIQARYGGSMDQDESSGVCAKKQSDPRHILNLRPTEFTDKMKVGIRERKLFKITTRFFFARITGLLDLLRWGTLGKEQVWGRQLIKRWVLDLLCWNIRHSHRDVERAIGYMSLGCGREVDVRNINMSHQHTLDLKLWDQIAHLQSKCRERKGLQRLSPEAV